MRHGWLGSEGGQKPEAAVLVSRHSRGGTPGLGVWRGGCIHELAEGLEGAIPSPSLLEVIKGSSKCIRRKKIC